RDRAQARVDLGQPGVQGRRLGHDGEPIVRSGAGGAARGGKTRKARASRNRYRAPSSAAAASATCVGVRPTRTPLLSSASALATAVPWEPETIAPAWPIVLPGGAVKPAM